LIFQLELKDASQLLSDLPTGSLAIMKSQRVKEVVTDLSLSANHKMAQLDHKPLRHLLLRLKPRELQQIVLQGTELEQGKLANS
jgi:hypothetical protein